MKISRDNLSGSDLNLLFSKDAGRFIEGLVLNLLWAKDSQNEMHLIAKQRYIFEEWLKFYSKSVHDEAIKLNKVQEMVAAAERRGQIAALTNLPMKRGIFGKRINYAALNKQIADLKHGR